VEGKAKGEDKDKVKHKPTHATICSVNGTMKNCQAIKKVEKA
jgi:hypothetical protein